jgi:hypothetical protein
MATPQNLGDEDPVLSKLLLSTEDKKEYRKVLDGVIAVFQPIDPVKENLVKHYVYDSFLIDRLQRHITIAIERRYQETKGFRLERAKARKVREEDRARAKLVEAGTQPSDIARLVAQEAKVEDAVREIDRIFDAAVSETDHNVAFERSMVFIESLDRMLQNAHRRRRDTLQLLEFYEAGLAHKASTATDNALKASQPKEESVAEITDAPSIVPASDPEENHDVESQNRSEPTQ